MTTPVDARIIHVTDAYDAMTTDRPYRPGMTHGQALEALEGNAGTQFDPEVVRRFAELEFTGIAEMGRQNALSGSAKC
jgi:HD-GYP domain-containing protein (c-di-GMP phosphodiesterase class II)